MSSVSDANPSGALGGSNLFPGMRYKVLHAPFVYARASPSTSARIVSQRPVGSFIHALDRRRTDGYD